MWVDIFDIFDVNVAFWLFLRVGINYFKMKCVCVWLCYLFSKFLEIFEEKYCHVNLSDEIKKNAKIFVTFFVWTIYLQIQLNNTELVLDPNNKKCAL